MSARTCMCIRVCMKNDECIYKYKKNCVKRIMKDKKRKKNQNSCGTHSIVRKKSEK
jgi:hypothetical protein